MLGGGGSDGREQAYQNENETLRRSNHQPEREEKASRQKMTGKCKRGCTIVLEKRPGRGSSPESKKGVQSQGGK